MVESVYLHEIYELSWILANFGDSIRPEEAFQLFDWGSKGWLVMTSWTKPQHKLPTPSL